MKRQISSPKSQIPNLASAICHWILDISHCSFLICLVLLFLAAGCRGQKEQATPITVSPTPPATATTEAKPTGDTVEIVIYDDQVVGDWTLANSWGVFYDPANTDRVHGGRRAIAVTPKEDFGGLFFSVTPRAKAGYPRSRYLGLRFWLNSGDEPLDPSRLAVALTGHNTYPYWSREASSAPQDKTPFTSEVRLHSLGVTQKIAPGTWAKVELWFQQLTSQPAYRYITGFYVKSDQGYRSTFYVDDASLIAIHHTVPPVVVEVGNPDLDTVVVEFSEDVAPRDASDRAHYRLSSPADPSYAVPRLPDAAEYEVVSRQAVLALGIPLQPGATYELHVSGVNDLAMPPNPVAEGTVVAFTATALVVEVDVTRDVHPISPYIYGMSGPPLKYMQDLRITLNNWSGNPSTRYNWQLGNAWSAARDWQYRNGDYGYRGQSASDDFVRGNIAASAESRITVPTIGWVAKDTTSCSFPQPDGSCGNAGGASCERPGPTADPRQTSVEAPPEFMAAWVNHLVNEMGFKIKFFAMDNEPDIWGVTHYDVHPRCTTYDEIYERFVAYAEAVKAVAPESEILGPISCCWWYYWNSMAGEADKQAHGGIDFLPWFLQQMAGYEARTGKRLLDVLDVHYYPAGFYSDETSVEVAAVRLRATRSLWDPTFVDESWIGEPVYLIPRMHDLIATYYPGTRFGISEWNWGAEETMNGAIAIADVLGIYGREGLYFATYWRYPDQYSPGYLAFKIYTNYDGQGSRFGDTSVRAVSGNVDTVGAYAALDSASGNLHLMLINKSPDRDTTVQVRLAEFIPVSTATLYRYDADHIGEIVSDKLPVGPEFSVMLPPYSITLLVMETAF